jgi:hypothetical protein
LADDAREGWFYLKRLFFPNRLGGATFEGIAAKGDLLRCLRLAEDVALANFVVPAEMIGSGGRAETAVNAGGIDVEASEGVLGQAVENVGHEMGLGLVDGPFLVQAKKCVKCIKLML